MDTRSPTLAEQVAAAQDWWREAGVDSDFADEPLDWVHKPVEPAPDRSPAAATVKPAEPLIPAFGGPAAMWPQALADFAPWWEASDQLETGGTAPRVAARGAENAELMILVPMPEESDRERLLAGPQGRLISNMLAAMGIAQESAYLAAALPRHLGHPDWHALAAGALGQVLVHHVNLVAPKRLLVLGRAMLPLFGHDPAQVGATSRRIEVQGCRVPALVSFGPEALLSTPRLRSGLWRSWLEWTGGAE